VVEEEESGRGAAAIGAEPYQPEIYEYIYI
jgi:hypothetical protein